VPSRTKENTLSRNFELLQRASKDDRWQGDATPQPAISPTYEMRPVPEAHVLSREKLMKLVQTVFFRPGKESLRVVVFTGAVSGTGCSSICLGVAEALAAQTDEPVCIVDSNLRLPSLHLCLGVDNREGLSEALGSGEPLRKYIHKLPAPNLWFLSSGRSSSPMRGVMSSSRLASRMVELRQEFRYALMDSPPVNVYSDAIPLGQTADGVILVVAANSTRREAACKAKASFESAGARLLGVVLNNRTYPIPRVIYDRL
jgi:protein-tyrosine kinase